MGSYREEEEEEGWFHDAREEISSSSDLSDDCSCSALKSSSLDVWIKNPDSVSSRRRRFIESMGLSFERVLTTSEDSGDDYSDNGIQFDAERVREDSGAVLRTSCCQEGRSPNQSSVSCSLNYAQETTESGRLEDNVDEAKDLGDQVLFVMDESNQVGIVSGLSESGSIKSVSYNDSQNSVGSSISDHRSFHGEVDEVRDFTGANVKAKKGWLRKFGAIKRFLDKDDEAASESSDRESVGSSVGKMRMVRVQPCKKQFKELSSLYMGQEFSAHEGSILTMKFSLDGKYLASAGEDAVVRVWEIIEGERADTYDIPETDPSCLYFGMDDSSQLTPLYVENEKIDKNKRWRKSSDSTCVILPPKVFRISETPLHEFRGHKGEVLDLSWSQKGFLLSSSVDETVCLWQVGCDRCVSVFSHKNYVTCVAFNPVDDNYFISGSIDGKVRIWDVLNCRVVDYTDITDIVTAVCYRPDGKGAIVGSMTGNCWFYYLIDGELQLDAKICLQAKKKLPGKRITSFQFFPNDSNKVMVTSVDSQIRILCGADIICKLKAPGLRTAGSPMFASFTSDGKHVVSATGDSSIHVWNYTNPDKYSSCKTKSIRSCESFVSHNTSVAIPWSGIQSMSPPLPSPTRHYDLIRDLDRKKPHFPSDCFSLPRGFLVESLMKGSMTWPEEKLAEASPVAAVSPTMSRSKFKFLRNACQNMFGSPNMWGLVIVTATWDGWIRTYHNYGLPVHL